MASSAALQPATSIFPEMENPCGIIMDPPLNVTILGNKGEADIYAKQPKLFTLIPLEDPPGHLVAASKGSIPDSAIAGGRSLAQSWNLLDSVSPRMPNTFIRNKSACQIQLVIDSDILFLLYKKIT